MQVVNASRVWDQLGNSLSFYPQLTYITGSINAAIFVSKLREWRNAGFADQDGWVFWRQEYLEETLVMSKAELKAIRKLLKVSGLVQEKKKGCPPIVGFRIDAAVLNELWEKYLNSGESALSERRQNLY